jgi:hypothetical protein
VRLQNGKALPNAAELKVPNTFLASAQDSDVSQNKILIKNIQFQDLK